MTTKMPAGNTVLSKCGLEEHYCPIGQILIAGQLINDGKNEIHLERLSKGVYFYKFISNAHTVLTGKIIKQ